MSRVIRGAGATTRVLPGELAAARTDAERILDEARAEATRIVERAHDEAERVRRAARDEGLEAAHVEAARMLIEGARSRDAALALAERDAQTLALAATAKIVGEAIVIEPARIAAIVRDALTRARRARSVEVHVHPEDVAALERAQLELAVRVVPDAMLTRGGCVVRSELGVIDARVEVRIDAIARLLGCETP